MDIVIYQLFLIFVIISQGDCLECMKCYSSSKFTCNQKLVNCTGTGDRCYSLQYSSKTNIKNNKTLGVGIKKGCARAPFDCYEYCMEYEMHDFACKVNCCSSGRCNEDKYVYQNKKKRSNGDDKTNKGTLLYNNHVTLASLLLIVTSFILSS